MAVARTCDFIYGWSILASRLGSHRFPHREKPGEFLSEMNPLTHSRFLFAQSVCSGRVSLCHPDNLPHENHEKGLHGVGGGGINFVRSQLNLPGW